MDAVTEVSDCLNRLSTLRGSADVPTALIEKAVHLVRARWDDRVRAIANRILQRSESSDPAVGSWTDLEKEVDLEAFALDMEADFMKADPAGVESDHSEWSPEPYADILDDFLIESDDLVGRIEDILLRIEKEQDPETLNEIFRYAHTLKGTCGILHLTPASEVAHGMENLLDELRKKTLSPTRERVDALLSGLDSLRNILERVHRKEPFQMDPATIHEVTARLDAVMNPSTSIKTVGATSRSPSHGGVAAAPTPFNASRPESPQPMARKQEEAILRVASVRLDRLMRVSGELLINNSRMHQLIHDLRTSFRGVDRDPDPQKLHALINRLVDTQDRAELISHDLQRGVNGIRMVPLAQVFNRLPRLVRDLGRDLGKSVSLIVEGEDVEVDKQIVEGLNDPLLHLVRNAMDHGIEPPDVRQGSGKPAEGTLEIRAVQEGEKILIQISDDGAGIDVEKVRARAIEKAMVGLDEAMRMDREAILDLLFAPGFSTRGDVTEVSGRGVGLDVVKSAVESLKGSVTVDTEPGEGTVITLHLPVALGVMDVLMVGAAGRRFTLPLAYVDETRMVAAADVHMVGRQEVVEVRGRAVPFVPLHRLLDLSSTRFASLPAFPSVLIRSGNRAHLIGVEELIGKEKIVMKGLGSFLEKVGGVSGATILGDGQAVLILNPQELLVHMGALDPARPAAIHPANPAAASELTALVTDDSHLFRAEIGALLRSIGYRVVEASSGDEALARLRTARFDLFTVDVQMPGMDGYELTRRIRANPAHSGTPLIVVSSLSEPVDKTRGFQAGADAYLTKPVRREELAQALSSLAPAPVEKSP